MKIRAYAATQVSSLLGRLVFRINRVLKSSDPEAVHDLRVVIRRFAQGLRVFGPLLRSAEAKRIRRRLRRIASAAAEVRNRDVALQLCTEAGVPAEGLIAGLREEREQARQRLIKRLGRLRRRDFSRKWRKRLRL